MNKRVRNILHGIAKRKKRKLNTDDPFDSEKIVSGSDIDMYQSNVTFRGRCIFQPLVGRPFTKKECNRLMKKYFLAELIQEDDTTFVYDVEGNPPIRTMQVFIENDILKDYFFCK